ncbi:MAG: thioesterase [Bacillota bacterium]|nr:thioesterase [Bacillota bacterium]
MAKKTMTKDYEIHYYEVDFRKRMHITSLVDFLGDIATHQSENLGVGMDYLASRGLGWVLYKWDIKMHRYPVYGETISVKTYPYGFKSFYAYRKFEVYDKSGGLIAEAGSIWLLVNAEKKKPVRVDSEMFYAYGIEENCKDTIEIEEIKKPERTDEEKIFSVRYSDIDTNRHVNNSKYASWGIEVIPMDIVLNYSIKRMKITYQRETKYGDIVNSKVQINNRGHEVLCSHLIEDGEGSALTLLETYWKKEE